MGDAGEERERFVDVDPLGDQVIADLRHVPCSTSLDTASEDHRLREGLRLLSEYYPDRLIKARDRQRAGLVADR